MLPTTKLCPKCNVDKSVTAFYVDNSRPDGRQYRCKDCVKVVDRTRNQFYYKTPQNRFRECKRNAKGRGLDFNLTYAEWISVSRHACVYCGQCNVTYGIDRVDNAIGYTISNIVSACSLCNRMKWTLSIDEFRQHIEYIHAFMSKCL